MMPTVLKTSQSATGIADRGDHQSTAQLRSRWIGMNSAMMCNYIKFCADRLLIAFGCRHHYKVDNPFEWMEMISLQGKTNFFEKRVGDYLKSGVGVDRVDQTFALDTSF